jgi:hypothetical protein
MNKWEKDDVIDTLLKKISRTYKSKSTAVTQWAADLVENRIWRGSNTTRTPVRVANRRKGGPRKRKDSKAKRASATPPIPVKVWTKEQREEASKKKADEADAAAANGVRRSRRARVPTEKVLNGE